jgi:hypothetical protein
MKELSFDDLEVISGGWSGVGWGIVTSAVWDGAKAAASWTYNNITTATDGSNSTNCDALGSCY